MDEETGHRHKKITDDLMLLVSDLVLRATGVQRRKTDDSRVRQLLLRGLQELVRVRTEDFIAKRECNDTCFKSRDIKIPWCNAHLSF